uniref:family 1 glycosylhydrolase n=1 Tax=Deinococcus sp. TaxID=47478 RepID=UPI0025EC6531
CVAAGALSVSVAIGDSFADIYSQVGSRVPSGGVICDMSNFMFATGIENSAPTILLPSGATKRVDEMEKCGHYARWREDFILVRELGISYLRYGPPLHLTHVRPGHYDWDFADETFGALREMDITPLADLCHFGVPDWIGGFDNPDWPLLFAEYARAFAVRFPWVHYYTPVNEIFVAATFSGQLGWWNERAVGDRGFVTALGNLCRANTLAMRAILEVNPLAVFIQSESSEYFHPADPGVMAQANILNEKRFLSLDLTYGRPVNAVMYEYLLDNGMTRAEYHWFMENQVKTNCVMGNDYYVTNEHMVHADGRVTPSGEVFGYYVITLQYYHRYRLPVMHTETNLADADKSWDWLWKQWTNLFRLRSDGVPIIGFTWYSLTDQVDWDTALREDAGRVNPVGLCDMDRNIRRVGYEYRKLIQHWSGLLPTGSVSLDLP